MKAVAIMAGVGRRGFLFGSIGLCVLGSAGVAQGAEPLAIITGIFEAYRRDQVPDVPWTPAIVASRRRKPWDADRILDAQDVDVKRFAAREISRAADRAVVEVDFESFGQNKRGQFDFRLVDGRWMVANFRLLSGGDSGPTDLRRQIGLPPLT